MSHYLATCAPALTFAPLEGSPEPSRRKAWSQVIPHTESRCRGVSKEEQPRPQESKRKGKGTQCQTAGPSWPPLS